MSELVRRFQSGRFLVLVSPPKNDPELVAAAFAAGADGAKVHCNVAHRASGTRFGSWEEERPRVLEMLAAATGPLGVMPGAEVLPSPEDMASMAAAGLDFFDIYDAHMPEWMWEVPMARMVALGHPADPPRAAQLAARGMDVLEASVIDPAGYGQPLTEADVAGYRDLVAATPRPVLVPSQRGLVPGDLARLAAVGVGAVLLGTLSLGSGLDELRDRLPAFVEAARELGAE